MVDSAKQSDPIVVDSQSDMTFISISDFVAGMSQLAIIGVIETTGIVEAIHREIVLRPLGLLNHRYGRLWNKGISGRVYGVVKGITSVVGHGLSLGITQYSHLTRHLPTQPLPSHLNAAVNVINGVMGDHLVSNHNPLALPMTLYKFDKHLGLDDKHHLSAQMQIKPMSVSIKRPVRSDSLANPNSSANSDRLNTTANTTQTNRQADPITGRVVILLHGLCMGHINWQPTNPQGLGLAILRALPEVTLYYVSYNTGQRISTNGRQFAALLDHLITENPDISQIDLVGHSMGGLVSRSALYYGTQAQYEWVEKVGKLITLGTPHHGAVLERIGDFVQQSIAKLPFAGALAKLGYIRSVGIVDLRHGSVRDEDWQLLQSRSVLPDEVRHFTPLPEHISSYFLAGSLSQAEDESDMSQLLGDGLVNIPSALGEHTPAQTLGVSDTHKAVFYEVSHFALLTDERVLNQTVEWLVKD
ncbi:esterase/lipase family protein [Psychrobacter sp. FDAARGOS_221]|uniref:esterase/lipase family protein n=1 Tax=Psychrobacter sp. FDAARGOS_221 TaxID=1975705 RepID=UPI000BB52C7B|nr:alpha/beta fold hydrolase [Psychrobacter sp. FDAARGOS_221]PNK60249.1 hypothetical protein A6J60_004775 [Psychrobacter sp. FDAARGOS_221]